MSTLNEKVAALVEMGFEESKCVEALNAIDEPKTTDKAVSTAEVL